MGGRPAKVPAPVFQRRKADHERAEWSTPPQLFDSALGPATDGVRGESELCDTCMYMILRHVLCFVGVKSTLYIACIVCIIHGMCITEVHL